MPQPNNSVRFVDKGLALPTKRKFKDSGQMLAPASLARTGIMNYRAGECGALFKDRDPNSIVRIMTSAEELFDAESLESYRAAPITIGHPEDDVTIENARELQRGQLESIPTKGLDNETLEGNIVLNDADAINLVETGTSDLSSGHDCILRLADEGVEWDAEKTKIRVNHIAIVPVGRAGTASIADSGEAVKDVEEEVVDEKEATEETAEKQEPVLTAKAELSDAETISTLKDSLVKATATLDATVAKLSDAEAKLKDEAYITSRVKERLQFLDEARQFTDANLLDMSEREAKLVILKDHLGRDFSDREDQYIDIRYSILREDGVPEDDAGSITNALRDHATNPPMLTPVNKSASESSRERMIARNTGKA